MGSRSRILSDTGTVPFDEEVRFAELMITALPPDPSRLVTKSDLAVLGSELRMEMAELKATVRVEMRELTSQQPAG